MIEWFTEVTKSWDGKTWMIFWGFWLSVLTLLCSRFQKYFEKERYLMFKEAESLTAEEQKMANASEQAFNDWFDELDSDDKKRIRQSRGFLTECATLKEKHLGERYFEQLAALNTWLQRIIGDEPKPVVTAKNPWQWFNQTFFSINPFNVWTYCLCLLLALVYPFVLALGSWVFTGTLQLGNVVLGEGDNVSDRVLTICVLVMMVLLGFKGIKTDKIRVWQVCIALTLTLSVLVTFFNNSQFAFAVGGAAAVGGALSLSLSLSLSLPLALSLAVALSLPLQL